MRIRIWLNVEGYGGGEIVVSKGWQGETHIQIKDEPPVSKEVLLECIDKIEAELEGIK